MLRLFNRTIPKIVSNRSFSTANQLMLSRQSRNKIIVTRTPGQAYSLYIDNQETVEGFRANTQRLFPDSPILIFNGTKNLTNALNETNKSQIENWYQQIKHFPLIDALILNQIIVCELSQQEMPEIIYGVEIAEYNLTNRINIPEHIQQGVVELNNQWERGMTVGDAISYQNIRRYEDGNLNTQTGQSLTNNLNKTEEAALQDSILALLQLKQHSESGMKSFFPNFSNKLMKQILSLMSVQWVFLFAITYGKYGWDVGEPISYLSGLAVDLVAMVGLFETESALIKKTEQQKQILSAVMNIGANKRMHQWRVAYLSRKLIVD